MIVKKNTKQKDKREDSVQEHMLMESNPPKRLYRSETDVILGGVAGGLGEFLDIDSSLIRIIFVLVTIFGGSGLIIYIILWVIIPAKSYSGIQANDERVLKENVLEIKNKTRELVKNIRDNDKTDSKFWVGVIIIVIGAILLFDNIGVFSFFSFTRFWPLLVVGLGTLILLRK